MNPINIAITLFKVFTARKTATKTTKQWYQSKGIMGNVAAILGTVGVMYGVDVPLDQLEVIVTALVTVVANIVGIMGRINAKTKLNGVQ